MPMNDTTKFLITQATGQISAISESLASIAKETRRLAALLPEYSVVMDFRGVGDVLGPQLMAEIGDIYRYPKKSSLVRFAVLEPVENSSGKFHGTEKISKQGFPASSQDLISGGGLLAQTSPRQ